VNTRTAVKLPVHCSKSTANIVGDIKMAHFLIEVQVKGRPGGYGDAPASLMAGKLTDLPITGCGILEYTIGKARRRE
jgi:hypothetical protein